MKRSMMRVVVLVATLFVLGACDDSKDKKVKEETAPEEEPVPADFAITFADDFNRADGLLGANWTTDIPDGSTLSIAGNRALFGSNSGSPTAFVPTVLASGGSERLSVALFVSGGDYDNTSAPTFLIDRASTPDHGFISGNGYACGPISNQLVIWYLNGGVQTELSRGTQTLTLTDGAVYALRFTVDAGTLTCEATSVGVAVDTISATEATLDGGYAGIIGGASQLVVYVDDFVLETK
jgi:hypothetical protein